MMEIVWNILSDGLFAAIAAIGFGAISDPPMRAFPRIAILAAAGHALRYTLMTYFGVDIATGSLCASLTIGFGSMMLGRRIHCPTTVMSIPALLPMIPGMFAYKSMFSIVMFFQHLDSTVDATVYLDGALRNGMITVFVILMLAAGATLPILMFPSKAYTMTRRKEYPQRPNTI